MTLITPGYMALNAEQHQLSNGYGERGYKHLDDVLHVLRREDCHSVLDYGCGKATLSKHARRVCEVPFANYDPAIPEFAGAPNGADLVVCTDVLEHVEPACIVSVLDHIASLAEKAVYLQIATRPAKRTLSNGQNAHILQRDPYWWWNILAPRFDITDLRVAPGHSLVIVAKRQGTIYP
jgi:hypothetical protein